MLFWRKQIEKCPSRIAFSQDARLALLDLDGTFDHIEFLMIWLENHPLIPLHQYTFGSHLLDTRRAVAYEVVLRVRAHLRSLVVNVNIRNKPGIGTALRCLLDIHALLRISKRVIGYRTRPFLEKFLSGQQFAKGSDYFLNREWSKDTGESLPADLKKVLESWFGLPRTGLSRRRHTTPTRGFPRCLLVTPNTCISLLLVPVRRLKTSTGTRSHVLSALRRISTILKEANSRTPC